MGWLADMYRRIRGEKSPPKKRAKPKPEVVRGPSGDKYLIHKKRKKR